MPDKQAKTKPQAGIELVTDLTNLGSVGDFIADHDPRLAGMNVTALVRSGHARIASRKPDEKGDD